MSCFPLIFFILENYFSIKKFIYKKWVFNVILNELVNI